MLIYIGLILKNISNRWSRVLYLYLLVFIKLWDIDLTGRVSSFIKGTNIEASGLKFPSGEHEIEIRIKDQEKMESRLIFTIKVV